MASNLVGPDGQLDGFLLEAEVRTDEDQGGRDTNPQQDQGQQGGERGGGR